MARTAQLSRRFYETFGDDNTNELVALLNAMDSTYLTELRTLNDMNFARFDANMERRISELGAELRTEFRTALAELRTHTDVGFANLRSEIAHANTVALRWFVTLTVTTLVTVAGTLIAAALQ